MLRGVFVILFLMPVLLFAQQNEGFNEPTDDVQLFFDVQDAASGAIGTALKDVFGDSLALKEIESEQISDSLAAYGAEQEETNYEVKIYRPSSQQGYADSMGYEAYTQTMNQGLKGQVALFAIGIGMIEPSVLQGYHVGNSFVDQMSQRTHRAMELFRNQLKDSKTSNAETALSQMNQCITRAAEFYQTKSSDIVLDGCLNRFRQVQNRNVNVNLAQGVLNQSDHFYEQIKAKLEENGN